MAFGLAPFRYTFRIFSARLSSMHLRVPSMLTVYLLSIAATPRRRLGLPPAPLAGKSRET
jgi:hypothetical protein